MVTVIKKVDWDGSHQIGFVNDWKCSDEMRFVIFEGSKRQRLDGSVKTRSGTFTHRTPARQAEGGASSGVESGVGSFGLDSIQDWTQHSSRGISGVRSLWGVTLK